jgi:hypothetical protein
MQFYIIVTSYSCMLLTYKMFQVTCITHISSSTNEVKTDIFVCIFSYVFCNKSSFEDSLVYIMFIFVLVNINKLQIQ